jgi:hypothetical protein
MKKIKLTQGKFALVDDDDFDYLNQWKWYAHKNGYVFYAGRALGGKSIKMHRTILNNPVGMEVDHRNGNGLDNQRKNLRVATRTQNHANVAKLKNNTSGFKGVSYNKASKKFHAYIRTGGKNSKTIGYFETAEEASFAYKKAAVEIFGEFAHF